MDIEVLLGIEPANETGSFYNLELEVKNRRYTARLVLTHADLHLIAQNVLSVVDVNQIPNPLYIFNWVGDDETQKQTTIATLTTMLYHREAYARCLSQQHNLSPES